MYFRILAALALIAVVGFFGTGCEVNVGAKQAVTNGVPTSTTNPTSTTQTNPITQTTTPIPTNFVDELDVSGAITYGTHADSLQVRYRKRKGLSGFPAADRLAA